MLMSYEWLKTLVSISDISAEELAEKMSRTGIEVDGIHTLNDGLKKVVVGETLSVVDHPDSDHLHICQVNVGDDEPLQIVCGAPNVQAKQKVIVALPNSWIAGHTKIKKGKMRGVVSQGMICSLEEIGIDHALVPKEYESGIMVLPADAPVGMDIVAYLQLDDPILDLDVTPNRADAFSMFGDAYEVAAIYGREVHLPQIDTTPYTLQATATPAVNVSVTDQEAVKAYNAVLVKNVTVKPSPLWLQMRLIKAGIRPINNVVDITNYLLMAYGQPLHAFDYDKVASHRIVTRQAQAGETLVTLDGEERVLAAEDIVITDGTKPIALGGVMGGLDTEITAQTTNVLLEAAIFDGARVRKTARRLGLRSESSIRNERGVNPETTLTAAIHAAQMIQELAGGEPDETIIHQNTVATEPVVVESSVSAINQLLGLDLDYAAMATIFNQLGFTVSGSKDAFAVSVPPRRLDVQIEADLAEEVARIYGYDHIPSTLPELKPTHIGLNAEQQFLRTTHRVLTGMGYDEIISYSLTSAAKVDRLARDQREAVQLDHPLSDDRRYMRTNLLTAMLDVAEYNVARKTTDLKLYEVGRTYYRNQEQAIVEETHLSGLWAGNRTASDWTGKAVPVDFFQVKGSVERYLAALNLAGTVHFKANTELEGMHPGQTADIYFTTVDGEQRVGFLGNLHPTLATAYDLPSQTFVFELNLASLMAQTQRQIVQSPLPKYPGMARDIAMIVPERTTYAEIEAVIRETAAQYLQDIQVFDIYRGAHIAAGKKSMAFSLFYQNPAATLVDDEVSADVERVQAALVSAFGAEIR